MFGGVVGDVNVEGVSVVVGGLFGGLDVLWPNAVSHQLVIIGEI